MLVPTLQADAASNAKLRRFLAKRSPGRGIYVDAGEDQPTLEALRWAVEIKSMLGDPISPDVTAFVQACRRSADAYAMRADRCEPDLAATYYALRILALSGRWDLIPPRVNDWLENAVFAGNGSVAVDVDDLFYAIRALRQIPAGMPGSSGIVPESGTGQIVPESGTGQIVPESGTYGMPAERLESIASFIGACADPGGGYGLLPGAPPDIERTYCCLQMQHILREWGAPPAFAGGGADAGWVERCIGDGAVRWSPESRATSMATVYWGTHAAILCELPFPGREIAVTVEAARRPDGAFGEERSTLWHTYCALRVLTLIRQRFLS